LFHSLSEKNVCGEADGEMYAIEGMQSRLLASESEMDNLRNIIDCCSIPFQQRNVFREKLQTLSDALKDLATQLKFLLESWAGSLTQHPSMQQLNERRQQHWSIIVRNLNRKPGRDTCNIEVITTQKMK